MMKLTGSDSRIYAVMHVAIVFVYTQQGRIYSMLFPYYIQKGFAPGWPWYYIVNTGLSLTQNLKCLVYSLYKYSHIHACT